MNLKHIKCPVFAALPDLWGELELDCIPLKRPRAFPDGSDGNDSGCNAGYPGVILGWKDPLEKGMDTDFNILAWRIPWTEEPGRLQSMGSLRVRLEALVPSRDSRARTRSPSPRAWRPDFPGAAREAP